MIVLDASAALSALLNVGPARDALATEQIHVPHLIDVEVTGGLRRMVRARQMSQAEGWALLDTWRRLGITRYPVFSILHRVWQLRENLSAYDACYVTLAELLGCALMTADGRIGRVRGTRCPVTVVPR